MISITSLTRVTHLADPNKCKVIQVCEPYQNKNDLIRRDMLSYDWDMLSYDWRTAVFGV